MNARKTTIKTSIPTTRSKCMRELAKSSNDNTVLVHHVSKAGITKLKIAYPLIMNTAKINTITIQPSPLEPFSDFIETSRPVIDAEILNCFPAEAHRDFPISIAAGRKQLCESNQRN